MNPPTYLGSQSGSCHVLTPQLRKNQGTMFCRRAIFLQVLIGLGALWMLSGSLQAATIWNGSGGTGGDGNWSTGADWSAGVPTTLEDARFQVDGTLTTAAAEIDLTGPQEVKVLTVGEGKSVTLNMADGASLAASGNSNVGNLSLGTGTGPANLTIEGPGTGSATYSHIRIDVFNNSSMVVAGNVTGTGTGDSSIGRGAAAQGSSSLSVLDGANISFATLAVGRGSSDNFLLASGAGSSFTTSSGLSVGTSSGSANVGNSARAENGGQIIVTALGALGQGVGDHSNYFEVTGSNSVLTIDTLRVGDQTASPRNIGGNYLRIASGGTAKMDGDIDINSYDDSSTNFGSNYVLVDAGGTLTHSRTDVRNKGLLQLASGGAIEGRDLAGTPLNSVITVDSGGRFEAAGAGLGADTTVRTTVESGAAFSVGLGDAVAASTLTLSNSDSWLRLESGSTFEIGLFGVNLNDTLQLDAADAFVVLSGVTVKLTLQGYVPVDGNSWSIVSGLSSGFSSGSDANFAAATFDLPALSGGLSWDTTNFSSVGGWEVSVVPEPSTFLLVGVSLCGLLISRRRKHS